MPRIGIIGGSGVYNPDRFELKETVFPDTPYVITHAPGHMFITDILNSELNDYLESKKHK